MFGLRALGLLETLELAAYDHLMRSRPAETIDDRIVVVEVAEPVTSEYGYPLPDEVLTSMIEKITQSQPLATGLDLHRGRPRPAQAAIASRWQAQQSQLDKPEPRPAMVDSLDAIDQPQGEEGAAFASAASPVGGDAYAKFLQQVEQTPNLFLVCAYSSTDENYQVPLQLSNQSKLDQVGFSELPVDTSFNGGGRSAVLPEGSVALSDASVRRQLLSYDPELATTPSTCTTPYSFSFQLAFQYLYEKGITPLEVTPDEHWKFGAVVFRSLPERFGGYQTLETPSSQILLNYRASQPAQKVSFEQLMSPSFNPDLLRDRIVLVGYNAPVSQDYFSTPYGAMPGLWIHTHMVSQLVSAVLDGRPLIHTLPQWGLWQWGDMLWILAWSCFGGSVAWGVSGYVSQYPEKKGLRLLWLLAIGSGALLLYGICWIAMISGLWLPLVPSGLAALGAAGVSATARRSA